jgi:nucleotide-binding universal stress UspA family protein
VKAAQNGSPRADAHPGAKAATPGGLPLYRNILIPTDGSALAAKAVEHGVALAREIGARVTAVTVTEPFAPSAVAPGHLPYSPQDYQERAAEFAATALAEAAEAARAAGVVCETLHRENEAVFRGIIEAAAEKSCDLIVMASHGRRGVAAIVLGSETVKVLTHSTIPVLVYR